MIESARSRAARLLAGQALTVAIGLLVAGAATIVMMSAAARALPAADYAGFAVWWTVATLLGTGFGVFETYLARLLVAESTAGRDGMDVIGHMLGRFLLSVGILTGGLLLSSPWLADPLFGGSRALALLLPLAVALMGAQALQRGAATGRAQFASIAWQLSVDGLLRASLSLLVLAIGAGSSMTLAIFACTAAAAGLVAATVAGPPWLAPPCLSGPQVPSRPLGYLLIGVAGPVLANNASLPWLAATGAEGPLVVGAFAGALTLSRVPTQFVSAAFAPLLAHLTRSVEEGDRVGYQHVHRRAVWSAALFAALFTVAFCVAGPDVLSAYLGPNFSLPIYVLGLLAAASGVLFLAFVEQASLAAGDRWAAIGLAWVGAIAIYLGVLLSPVSELTRAAIAPFAASCSAFVAMLLLLRRPAAGAPRVRAAAPPHRDGG